MADPVVTVNGAMTQDDQFLISITAEDGSLVSATVIDCREAWEDWVANHDEDFI